MPVSTETFRNMKLMNMVFAVSSVILLLCFIGIILDDASREWRVYQQDAQRWREEIFSASTRKVQSPQVVEQIKLYEMRLMQIEEEMGKQQYARLGHGQIETRSISEAEKQSETLALEIARIKLLADVAKGRRDVLDQQIEKQKLKIAGETDEAKLPEKKGKLKELSKARNELDKQFNSYNDKIAGFADEKSYLDSGIRAVKDQPEYKQLLRDIGDLNRQIDTAQKKLAQAAPTGLHFIDEKLRNAPGLDWLNPSEKPYQTVADKVHTDYNYVKVDTVDRCQSCHINIDDPLFERGKNIDFVTRLIAGHDQGDMSSVPEPAVMPEFWLDVASKLDGSVKRKIDKVKQHVLGLLQERVVASGLKLPEGDIVAKLAYAATQAGDDKVSRSQWYEPVSVFSSEIREIITKHVDKAYGEQTVRDLNELFRRKLISYYNENVNEGSNLSDSPVLLAHPEVENLFVGTDSKHPMATMACTVCHEGSGQETQFGHTAHTPRNVWVDEKSGAAIPNFLLAAGGTKSGHGKNEKENAALSQNGVNVLAKADATPLAPDMLNLDEHHADYNMPGSEEAYHAVKQTDYWKKHYGWHLIAYMYWEKPMHSLDYVQSSCIKCHTQVYDLQESAPSLYEGRKLFADVGCVNCHEIDQIAGGGDIRQVGPSLRHVSQKLSPQMLANWIWAPKSVRPTSKMPHYFMLENNSSPIDILRTRVEVMAMTWYLMQANPKAANQAKFLEAALVKSNDSLKKATDEIAAIDKMIKDGKDAEGESLSEAAKSEMLLKKESMLGAQAQANSEFRQVIEDMKKLLGSEAMSEQDPTVLLDQLWARVPSYEPKPIPAAEEKIAALSAEIDDLSKSKKDAKTNVEGADHEVSIRKAKLAIKSWQDAPLGDANKGRELFGNIGCQACHSNLDEYGAGWVAGALKDEAWFDIPPFEKTLTVPSADREVKELASKLARAIELPNLQGRWHENMSETKRDSLMAEIAEMIEKDLKAADTVADSVAFITERSLRDTWLEEAGRLIYENLGYNEQHTLARLVLDDKLVMKGPELSAVGSKLLAGRKFKVDDKGEPVLDDLGQLIYEEEAYKDALTWTFDWLLEPRNYHSYTVMPGFRLSDRESLDLAAYLLTLRRPNHDSEPGAQPGDKGYKPYQPHPFGFNLAGDEKPFATKDGTLADAESAQMLEEIILTLLSGKITRTMAKKQLETEIVSDADVKDGFFSDANLGQPKWQSPQYRLYFVGRKMIQHYGCNACHDINGFEDVGSACAKLDHWGAKDPHKLDFGYFYGAYDSMRENPVDIWKVKHEGLGADAAQIEGKTDDERIYQETVKWEQFSSLDKRPWLYHKLHNTRVYNRAQSGLDASEKADGSYDIGKPYDKLKMPKFHLTDKQVRSIVTFVTGTRKPLVDPILQKTGSEAKMRQLKGMQVAAKYACYNCHEIDGNDVSTRKYYDVFNDDGSLNYAMLWDVTAPRLVGQGAKTQPDWLVQFLQHVHQIRPLKGEGGQLEMRMPSFPITTDEATAIADYFSGWAQKQATDMKKFIEPILSYQQQQTQRQAVLELRLAKVRQSLADASLSAAARSQLEKLAQREETALEEVRSYAKQWFNGPDSKVAKALGGFKAFAYKMKLGDPAVKDGELDALGGQILAVKTSELKEQQEAAIERWNSILTQAKFLMDTWDIEYPYEGENAVPEMTPEEFARGHALFNQLQCVMCHVLGDEDELKQIWLNMNPDKQLAVATAESKLALSTGIDPELKALAAAHEEFYISQDKVDDETFKALMKEGQAAYALCAACHQPTGKGMAPMFPPLAGSDWVTTTVPERLVRIVLHGLQGPITINGKPFNSPAPMMPGQGAVLDDRKIAAVLTYVRNTWGNKAPAILPETVKAIREKEKTRTAMWTEKELLAIGDVPTVSGVKVDPKAAAALAASKVDVGEVDENAVPDMWGVVHTAPNLKFIPSRLQRPWLDKWLQNPKYIVPGSKMLPFWPGGSKRPGLNESHFGHTGKSQRDVLLDFLYHAGHTYYTLNEDKLPGRESKLIPVDQLAVITKPEIKRPKGNIAAPIIIGGAGGAKKKSLTELIDEAASDEDRMTLLMKEGGKAYSQICIACHQANGGGIPGQFPPLAGSEWVTTDQTNRIIALVLHGLQGPIEVKGQQYNGMMPAQGAVLNNAKVAAVITYIRNTWGNKGSMIDYKDVAKLRAESGVRGPWTAAELLEMKQ